MKLMMSYQKNLKFRQVKNNIFPVEVQEDHEELLIRRHVVTNSNVDDNDDMDVETTVSVPPQASQLSQPRTPEMLRRATTTTKNNPVQKSASPPTTKNNPVPKSATPPVAKQLTPKLSIVQRVQASRTTTTPRAKTSPLLIQRPIQKTTVSPLVLSM